MNLPELQTKSEIVKIDFESQRKSDLQKALFFAFERTKTDPYDTTSLVKDVLSEFPRLSGDTLKAALRNGGLGMYGRTFRLSTQEVCFWIRECTKPIKKQERI